MSSSALPVVVVTGATGQQGGSVVTHLLASKLYRIRGITRNPTSSASIALIKQGVEMVRAHADSVAELTKAYQGAYAVFGLTNFWDPEIAQDASKEVQQGKNQADAAVAAHVEIIIWSSLHDAHATIRARDADATWDAHHFTSKHLVEKYIRTLPITAAYVYAGFYCNNFSLFPPFAPTRLSPSSVEWALPLRADVGLPMFDATDTGMYVSRILAQPAVFKNRRVLMAKEYLTFAQIAAVYSKVTGERATSRFTTMNPAFPDSIVTSYRWFNEYGYYAGEEVGQDNIVPRESLTDWEQFLKKSGWRVAQ